MGSDPRRYFGIRIGGVGNMSTRKRRKITVNALDLVGRGILGAGCLVIAAIFAAIGILLLLIVLAM